MTTPELRSSLLEMRNNRFTYEHFERYYEGTNPELFFASRYREDLRETGRQYKVNISRAAVDAPLERTSVTGIACDNPGALDFLNEFWDENELDFESKDVHEKAYEYGDSYMIAMPDDTYATGVSAYIHAPKNVRVYYHIDKPRIKSHAIHTYNIFADGSVSYMAKGSEYFMVTVYYPDVIQRWVSTNPLPYDGAVDYNTVELRLLDEIPSPVPGVIPVFHFKTARPYGRSRLVDVVGPQEMHDTLTVTLMTSVTAAGYKQRYILSDKNPPSVLTDNFSDSPPPDDTDVDLEERRYVSGPDTLHHFAGQNVRVGTFEPTDSQNFLAPLEAVVSYAARAADIPESYYRATSQPQSGESYRQSQRPLQAVVDHCQRLFGATWSEVFNYVLSLKGMSAQAGIVWASQQIDDMDFWQTQTEKAALAAPADIRVPLFVEGGYKEEIAIELLGGPLQIATPRNIVQAPDIEDVIPPGTPSEEF